MTSRHQAVTLAFATVAALSAGTNYAVGAYLPQVGERLHLGSLAMNIIAASGNAGVYLSGPIIGWVVDRRGPQPVMVLAGACLFIGYLGLASMYNGGPDGLYAAGGLPALALGQLLTGIGGSAGLSAALKATSLSFAQTSRGTAIGIVVSGFGLSAFFYSTISRAHLVAAADPTSAFLVTLAVGCGISMFLGAVFVRPPPPTSVSPSAALYEPLASSAPHAHDVLSSDDVRGLSRSRSHSPAPAPPHHLADEYSLHSGIVVRDRDDEEQGGLLEADRPDYLRRRSSTPLLGKSGDDDDLRGGRGAHGAGDLDVSGWTLLRTTDFYLMFAFLGLCSGTGLMWINNLGTLVVTLSPPDAAPLDVALAQSRLVSLLSVLNCAGRLAVGFASDFFTHRAGPARFPRVYWLVVLSGVFVLSQLVAGRAKRVEDLTLPTAIVGAAYGMLFGSSPVVCLERFGLKFFSGNNGWLMLSPSVFANFSNLLFGAVYDAHTSSLASSPSLSSTASSSSIASSISSLARRAGAAPPVHRCTLGRECFATAFRATTLMSLAAVGLACWISSRRSFQPVYRS
ncbi:hypothetical protein JCM3775_001022 [Rhodotorula graminis]